MELFKESKIETVNPATGDSIKEYSFMTDEEAAQEVTKCHKAFLDWKLKPLDERAEFIKTIGEKLTANKPDLARLMTKEMGKIYRQSEREVDLCAEICNWTATNGPENLKVEERELPNGGRGIITYAPMGVIYGIQAWNAPAYQVVRYSIANLMAGNSVLLKHAENVTGTALLLEKIYLEAGLPEDLFKIIRINHKQSDKIIANKLVRGITLTGSPDTSKIIVEKAKEVLKKTALELGSSDAYIVLEDADLELAVKGCVQGNIYSNGEDSLTVKRIIVVEKIYDRFKEAFVRKMKGLKVGGPTDKETEIGPIAREDLRQKLHTQVEESLINGAEILCGGKLPEGKGYFYPPTVLGNVLPGQPAYDEELFGPVAALIKAKDDKDATKLANDSRFGLGGGIFSKNEEKAIELAQKYFDTGMVFVNSSGAPQSNMPFGGVKDSGYGRAHGGFGMREFVNVKSVILP